MSHSITGARDLVGSSLYLPDTQINGITTDLNSSAEADELSNAEAIVDYIGSSVENSITSSSPLGTNNCLIRSDGTGRQIQSSGIIIDDSDNVTGVTSLNITQLIVGDMTLSINTLSTSGELNLTQNGRVNLGTVMSINSSGYITSILNENDLISDDVTALATQKSIKAYVDNNTDDMVTANLNFSDNALIKADGSSKSVQSSGITISDADAVSGVSALTFTDSSILSSATNLIQSTSSFGSNNRLIRSDGASRLIQSSGITIDDADALSGVTSLNINSSTTVNGVIDDDTMASSSDTSLATSESIKAYVDSRPYDEFSRLITGGYTFSSGSTLFQQQFDIHYGTTFFLQCKIRANWYSEMSGGNTGSNAGYIEYSFNLNFNGGTASSVWDETGLLSLSYGTPTTVTLEKNYKYQYYTLSTWSITPSISLEYYDDESAGSFTGVILKVNLEPTSSVMQDSRIDFKLELMSPWRNITTVTNTQNWT